VSVKVDGQKDSEFASSYVLDADFLVSAVGQLNSPREPNIPGLKKFQGKMMHSARWDWSYDFSQKRVAIIGNGMQIHSPDPRYLVSMLISQLHRGNGGPDST
jgi:cation diffusion facilitator CzcD-associated flavoprotein CzcO